jgi:hypothetical protein
LLLKIGPIAKPRAGSVKESAATAGHEPPPGDRLALERARYLAVDGVLGGVLVVLAGQGA